jgi:rifampicin phosphotransferase
MHPDDTTCRFRVFRLIPYVPWFLLLLLATASSQETPRSLDRIESRAQFDELARVEFEGRFSSLPNLMFAVDRLEKGRVYYINSRRYRFHQEFLAANYLTLERGRKFYEQNYLSPSRRFLLGAVAWHANKGIFTFEFWEGDLLTPALLAETYRQLSSTFFEQVRFKPNSAGQVQLAQDEASIPHVMPSDLESVGDFVALNVAKGIGVLRIVDRMTEDVIIDRNEVVIFREPPLSLTPCSGVITTTFGTPLAHVNLLARGWGIPNAFIRNADETYKTLAGKFVYFEVDERKFVLRPAATSEAAEYGRRLAQQSNLLTPQADLEYRELTSLSSQRKTDARRFGAKSANLGEVSSAIRTGSVKDATVPPGFSVPFSHYVEFIHRNGLENDIVEMLGNDRFNHDPVYRRETLAKLRSRIEGGQLDERFASAVWSRTQSMFRGKGVFVRSSTNAEDLENFSGAGLYTTVPNVREREALMRAIKVVWASLWNYEAYEARESAGINQSAVYPAVLIQEGVAAESAGVLITRNPFDKDDSRGVYINAKRGLGLKVVSGQKVPEQIIFDSETGSVRVLTRSGEDSMLTFDEKGGLREVRIENERRVLTDEAVRRLSTTSLAIKRLFGGRDQDIEWVTIGSRIFIVQSRPYMQ